MIEEVTLKAGADEVTKPPQQKLPGITPKDQPPAEQSKPGSRLQALAKRPKYHEGKNAESAEIIRQMSKNEFNPVRQIQIRECIRQFDISLKMINDVKKAFLACDLDQNRCTTAEDLLLEMQERGLKYTPDQINFFLNILNVRDVYTG